MRIKDLINMGLKNLWRRKARTFLTILGVIIGSASIILMVSIGLGQERAMYKSMDAYGGVKTITVSSSRYGRDEGKTKDAPKLNKKTMDEISKIKGVDTVVEFLNVNLLLTSGRYETNIDVNGIDLKKADKLKIRLDSGSIPTPDSGASIILGKSLSRFFWDPKANYRNKQQEIVIDLINDPIKAYIDNKYTENGKRKTPIPLIVSGIAKEYTEYDYTGVMDINEILKLKKENLRKFPPSDSKEKKKLQDEIQDTVYSQFKVIVKDIKDVEAVQNTIKNMGLNSSSPMEFINQQKESMRQQQLVLGGIGMVSLIVAAIGIANTMVMAIYERTREIGVMKVIGADVSDILKMFLFEAAIIGLIGGFMGVLISYAGSSMINMLFNQAQSSMYLEMNMEPTGISYIPIWLMGLSVVFSMFIGILSGFIPAVKATQLSALEAIKTN